MGVSVRSGAFLVRRVTRTCGGMKPNQSRADSDVNAGLTVLTVRTPEWSMSQAQSRWRALMRRVTVVSIVDSAAPYNCEAAGVLHDSGRSLCRTWERKGFG